MDAERVLDAIFASALPIGLAWLDRDLRYVRINETLSRFNGVPSADTLGRTVAEVHPTAFPKVADILHQVLAGDDRFHDLRLTVETGPGTSKPGTPAEWVVSYLPLRAADGSVRGILAVTVNISVEQQLQRMHRESAAHLRRVIDSLFAFVGVLSPDGVLQEVNRAPLEAAGLRAEDVIGHPFWDIYWWNHDQGLQAWLREAAATAARGGTVRQDVVVRMVGDTRMPLDFMIAPLRDEQGRITHLVPSAIDISSRKADETLLKRLMARFQSTFESSPVGKALIDPPGILVLVNPAFCEVFGHAASELEGRSIIDLVPALLPALAADGAAPDLATMFDSRTVLEGLQRRRVPAVRRDGGHIDTEVSINRVGDSGAAQLLLTISDITERLRVQGELEASLREKTVLLNEVHHRVKNNLQVISSLLRLQARNAVPAVRAALEDSMMRVRAMALTHQLLYESHDFSALQLGTFLTRLAALLRETYRVSERTLQVQVDALPTHQQISLSQAVPCGLLVNEIISNAIKHAFPQGQAGRIEIAARVTEAGRVELSVRDDGIGVAAGHQLGGGDTLGFQLIPLLAEQLDARLEMHSAPGAGTTFRFDFALGDPA